MQSTILQQAGTKDKHAAGSLVLGKRIPDGQVDIDGNDAFVVDAEATESAEYKGTAGDSPLPASVSHFAPCGLNHAGSGNEYPHRLRNGDLLALLKLEPVGVIFKFDADPVNLQVVERNQLDLPALIRGGELSRKLKRYSG